MVRLKLDFLKNLENLERFQFHYGAIKTSVFRFQSLNNRRFNSTMVRLKHFTPTGLWIIKHSFNSTMVRLKLIKILERGFMFQLFQFHYGAIKTAVGADFRTR